MNPIVGQAWGSSDELKKCVFFGGSGYANIFRTAIFILTRISDQHAHPVSNHCHCGNQILFSLYCTDFLPLLSKFWLFLGEFAHSHPGRQVCQPDFSYMMTDSIATQDWIVLFNAGIRVSTIFMTPPQWEHLIAGFICATTVDTIFNTNWTTDNHFLLECRKPKLRARRNPFGKTCISSMRINSTPLTVLVFIIFVVLSS